MFSYFRVPKILFRDIKFKDLSTDAKTLYGSKIRVFEQPIPHSVRAAEISAGAGVSLPMTRKERWQRPINL